jgi:hypothetical protein
VDLEHRTTINTAYASTAVRRLPANCLRCQSVRTRSHLPQRPSTVGPLVACCWLQFAAGQVDLGPPRPCSLTSQRFHNIKPSNISAAGHKADRPSIRLGSITTSLLAMQTATILLRPLHNLNTLHAFLSPKWKATSCAMYVQLEQGAAA